MVALNMLFTSKFIMLYLPNISIFCKKIDCFGSH
jgi:hypothetical protein